MYPVNLPVGSLTMFDIFSLPFVSPLAVFDPISWLVIHWGVTKLTAIAICAGVVTVALVTSDMVFNWVRRARIRNRNAKYSRLIKESTYSSEQVHVIDMDASGNILAAKTFDGEDLDYDLRKLPAQTIINHVK